MQAIAEYDDLGRDAFLAKYGFGEALAFFLVHEGRRYDSKAIVGAAHGIEHPELGPLSNQQFSGGASSAAGVLRRLGFEVQVEMSPGRFRRVFGSLNVGTLPSGARAPHKPLLCLTALRRVRDGEERLAATTTVADELTDLLQRALPDVADPSPWEPIWRLEDELWEVVTDGSDLRFEQPTSSPPLSLLKTAGVRCGFTAETHRVLAGDSHLVDELQDLVVERYLQEVPSDVITSAAGRAVAGEAVWWVNQGQTYVQEREGGFIWAPTKSKSGRVFGHHSAVNNVRPGDVVLHYASGAVRAIGKVRTRASIAPKPEALPTELWLNEGYRAEVEYFELDAAIPLTELVDRPKSVGPFNHSGAVNQGYLYGLPHEWAERVRRTFADRWPAGSPWGRRNRWLFQANPTSWDLAANLGSWPIGELEDWTVSRYKDDIKNGDRVLLFSAGPDGGILALGSISGDTFMRPRPEWRTTGQGDDETAINVRLDAVLDPPISRSQLAQHPVLKNLAVLKMAAATNYKVTEEEWRAVEAIASGVDERLDEFVKWALKFRDDPEFAGAEVNYKIQIGERLRTALQTMGQQAVDWDKDFRRAFSAPNNLTDFRVHAPFVSWAIEHPVETIEAVDGLWSDAVPLAARVEEFVEWLPTDVPSGRGNRLSLCSLLLLAQDSHQWPSYRSTPAKTITDLLKRDDLAEPIGKRYEQFVDLIDELIERSAAVRPDAPFADRLEAQSAAWTVTAGKPLEQWDQATTQEFLRFRLQTGDLADAVTRFWKSGQYNEAQRLKAEGQRQTIADMLSPEALERTMAGEHSKLFGWLHSIAFGRIGGAGLKASRAAQQGHEPEMAEAFSTLLYGPTGVAERLEATINAAPSVPGMSSPLANKVLAAAEPATWIPYFTAEGNFGRVDLVSRLGLAPITTEDTIDRFIVSNDRLRDALTPYFGEDTWGMREFLRFYRNELAELQLQPDALAQLAQKLYVRREFLAEILDQLRDKRQAIFYGPPGTGKTYIALKLAHHLTDVEAVELVQFHPSYAYEDFVEGFRPTEEGRFALRDGPFKRMAEAARDDPDRTFVLIVDEINRGNVAKVFGELYFLLEYRDEPINLQYSEEEFTLPPNLLIIGTMNSADRSIGLLDGALRRRFRFVSFYPEDEELVNVLPAWLKQNAPTLTWLAPVLARANQLLNDKHLSIGPSHFLQEGLNEDTVKTIWKYSVLPYLEDQFFGREHELDKFKLEKLRSYVAGASQDITDGPTPATSD